MSAPILIMFDQLRISCRLFEAARRATASWLLDPEGSMTTAPAQQRAATEAFWSALEERSDDGAFLLSPVGAPSSRLILSGFAGRKKFAFPNGRGRARIIFQ